MPKIDLTKAAKDEEVVSNDTVDEQQQMTDETTEAGSDEQQTETASVLDKLFVKSSNTIVASARGNQLNATADLTAMATSIANDILQELNKPDVGAELEPLVAKSKEDNDAMDQLIANISPIDDINVDFLIKVGNDELEKMLRSQQSKRSRAKNKEGFEYEDYRTIVIAAVAEGLTRKAMGKPKGYSSGSFDGSDFTTAEIEEFKADSEKLAKAIRNVQSKKSIASKKADFDEQGEKWQHLLRQEAFLKNLRDSSKPVITPEIEEALSAKEAAAKLLQSVESIDNMSPDDVKDLFKKLNETLVGGVPTEATE
ncbi:hypothetical protein D3C87_914790 [compost metagenome]